MDRYGITDAQYSGILKEANPLDMGSTDWAEISGSNYDMGYAFGQNKGAAYGETHGFTNGKLQIAVQGQDINTPIINTVSQVNQAQFLNILIKSIRLSVQHQLICSITSWLWKVMQTEMELGMWLSGIVWEIREIRTVIMTTVQMM